MNPLATPTTLSRRKFIKTASLAGAGLLISSSPVRARTDDSKSRILIIGGGIAGLGAAHKLRNAGFHPVIIEARERLGGRIWTHQSGIDLGASWIHGKAGNPLMDLVRETKAETFEFDYNNHWRYGSEGELSDEADRLIDRNFSALEDEIAKWQDTAERATPLQQVIGEFSSRLPASERGDLRYAVNSSITLEYAADPSRLSLAYFDHGAEQRGGDLLLPGGYFRLLEALRPAAETHLGHIVQEIGWSGNEVTVLTDNGSFSGAGAIITLPLGVLKSGKVHFRSGLPEGHRQAIQRLGFGTLDKLALRFPNVAWPSDPHLFGFVGNGLWEEWVNLAPLNGQPILVGFNGGDLAKSMEPKSDKDLSDSAMGVLRKMFGASLPPPTEIIATRWRQDPYALGSYSNYAPGSSPKDRYALAAPLAEHVILAGEACSSKHPGTVHGALQSGRDAARFFIRHVTP